MNLILQGKRDKEIADELGLSFWTVRTHLTRIFARTHTSDRLSLALAVLTDRQREEHGRCRYK